MYTEINFKTKKALKEAVKAWNDYQIAAKAWCDYQIAPATRPLSAIMAGLAVAPPAVRIYAPGLGTPVKNGSEFLEGPHYPDPHTWYAQVEMRGGVVVKVK